MPDSTEAKFKTAVLVVHGMGIHRPLEMLRGIVRAVWGESGTTKRGAGGQKRLWFHPEWSSAADVDLPVITANATREGNLPKFDFHELYWSHLMSETRATAVLLWLFELGRKGPRLNPGYGALWWGTAIFIAFLILSVVFLLIRAIEWFSGVTEHRELLILVPAGLVVVITTIAVQVFRRERATILASKIKTIAIWACLFFVFFCLLTYMRWLAPIASYLLPIAVAGLATWFLMGKWGLYAFGGAFLISVAFFFLLLLTNVLLNWLSPDSFEFAKAPERIFAPWNLDSNWSAILAWLNITIYLVLNARFLQPYLGDAARYFRVAPATVAVRRDIRHQSVETLRHLHALGTYNRIIVVAHSLGSVIAYDMLRTYFARVAHGLPAKSSVFHDALIESGKNAAEIDCVDFRNNARNIIKSIAPDAPEPFQPTDTNILPQTWLVTDFVTLGSPLTHAHYLMCEGEDQKDLETDFKSRVDERQLPLCPPTNGEGKLQLTFKKDAASKPMIHHGALFGLTRWTNLYFPASNLFWGDAIGGPVSHLFGRCVKDVKISANETQNADFFCHVAYWDTERDGGCDAPHIKALKEAINLEDKLEPRLKA